MDGNLFICMFLEAPTLPGKELSRCFLDVKWMEVIRWSPGMLRKKTEGIKDGRKTWKQLSNYILGKEYCNGEGCIFKGVSPAGKSWERNSWGDLEQCFLDSYNLAHGIPSIKLCNNPFLLKMRQWMGSSSMSFFSFSLWHLAIFATTNRVAFEKVQSYGSYFKFDKSVLFGVLQRAQ